MDKQMAVMKIFRLALFTVTFLVCTVTLHAGNPVANVVEKEGNKTIELENDWIKIRVEPSRGGRISSFFLKSPQMELISQEKANNWWGMFHDLFSQQEYPGELLNNPYTVEAVKSSPEEATLKLSRMVTGQFRGFFPELEGLRVEKTYHLYANNPKLDVDIELVNTTSKGKTPLYWVQHIFAADGQGKDNNYFRPSCRGVDKTTYDIDKGVSVGNDVVTDIESGWTATLSPAKKTGILFLMDYNYLRQLYNAQSAFTTEWFYDKVLIPGNQSWKTRITCIPVDGFKNISYASERFIMDVQPTAKNINIILRATEQQKINKVIVNMVIWDTDKNLLAKEITTTFENMGMNPQTKQVDLPVTIDPSECIIELNLSSGNIREKTEVVISSRDRQAALLGGLGAEKVYRKVPPVKKKDFKKPEKIVHYPQTPPRSFIVEGPYHRMYRIPEAINNLGWQTPVQAQERSGEWSGNALSWFPQDYQNLMAFDVLILADVDANALGDEELEMVREFVAHGGGLLVIGGPFSFGPGGYAKTCLAEMLPVKGFRPFEIIPLKNPAWIPVKKNSLTADLKWDQKPSSPQIHALEAKEKGSIRVSADGYPVIVTGSYGKGRVAVVTATPLRETKEEGSTNFWEWKDWSVLLARLLEELRTAK